MKSSPESRRQVILEQLRKTGKLNLEHIAQALNVSTMTLNRDVRRLADEGLIKRAHGSILLPDPGQSRDICVVCRRPVSVRVQFLFVFPDGKSSAACCAHCGIAYLKSANLPKTVFATDFLYGTLFNAQEVTYLVDSRIDICCSPSVLAFQHPQDAHAFQTGFGGKLMNLVDAVEALFPEQARNYPPTG
jgi:hypothetical protein